ncbi:hypothetical protein IW245_004615 [Longispora fulva]|uniref:Uncharacterized protein n=1 Tax=Longispora fulva TaxID=619741 RepID=A0A8J7GVT5_9ACTN|nr:hypothetical protein [Longispora fulva]
MRTTVTTGPAPLTGPVTAPRLDVGFGGGY